MTSNNEQIYEHYWAYTAAWTNVCGGKFIEVLKCCVDFFDKNDIAFYTSEEYEKLQLEVKNITNIGDTSVRKGINQLVKIGFLKPYLGGYIPEAKEYLLCKSEKKRYSILSKVVYNHSNFLNSMTSPNIDNDGQIKFLLKTLEEVGYLDKRAIVSLMTIDLVDYPKGFLCKSELDLAYQKVVDNDFIERKFNQLGHLMNLLSKLDDLILHDGAIYFRTDAERLFGSGIDSKANIRDPYLQRIYKSELEEESKKHFNSDKPKCMLEGLTHPVLIASHIKPYSHCPNGDVSQFDVNNGLLLSKNTDSLFDLGYMTFDNNGIIIPSKTLDKDIVNYLSQFRLHESFINEKRMEYMEYHRNFVFDKRYDSFSAKKFVFGNI